MLSSFTFYMINPILTCNSHKSQPLQITKTDSIDALAACRYAEYNLKRLNPYTPSSYIYDEISNMHIKILICYIDIF